MAEAARMRCWVYRSAKKEEMYLYLRDKDGYERLPDALREGLGRLDLVMELELSAERKLARAEAAKVIEQLVDKGYYLQLPPASPLIGESKR